MKKSIFLFTFVLLVSSLAYGGDRVIKHFSRDGERIGFSVREGNRESHFDKFSNRLGYSIYSEDRVEKFTPTWNRKGYDEIFDDDLDEEESSK